MTQVLKLGGSVITEKDTEETVDAENLAALADAVAEHDDLVIVHGGGSFGHPHASEHGVSTDAGTHDARGARAIHDAMKRLNDAVLDALHERDVPALPVHPLSAGARSVAEGLSFDTTAVETMLAEGFVPVLHGDVIAHRGEGVTIVSGDELVVAVADAVGADRVGLCSAVPGVLDDEARVIPVIDSFDDVAEYLGGSDATDVTGGMAAKVRELLALDASAFVFDVSSTRAFLDGKDVGTRID